MPSRSYPWNSVDAAAKEIVGALIEETGLSLRAFADKTDGLIKYTRVRDICMGENAPMRLSEFFTICDVCGQDPAEIARRIKESALSASIEDGPSALPDPDAEAARIKALAARAKYAKATLHDEGKYLEKDFDD